jgi:hypothetical protein
MDTTAIWTAVTAAVVLILGAVGLGLKNTIALLFERLGARIRRGSVATGIRRLRLFHEALDRVQGLAFVDRTLVFRGRDSGGLPDPKRPFYVECLTGRTNSGVEQTDRYAFELKIDTHFCRVLEEMVGKDAVALTTNDMPDGQLKNMYVVDGVAHSVKYFLTVDGNELLFLSAASFSRPFTAVERGQLDLDVDRLRSALRA